MSHILTSRTITNRHAHEYMGRDWTCYSSEHLVDGISLDIGEMLSQLVADSLGERLFINFGATFSIMHALIES